MNISEDKTNERKCRASYENGGILRILPESTGELTAAEYAEFVNKRPKDFCITTVVVEPGVYVGESAEGLFTGSVTMNMTETCPIVFDLRCLDISRVKTTRQMFASLYRTEAILFGPYETPNLEDASSMFEECNKLKTIDFGEMTGKNIDTLSCAFRRCYKLRFIDFKNMVPKKVRFLRSTFQECSSIQKLDLSAFDLSALLDCRYMCAECINLKKVIFGYSERTIIPKTSGVFLKDRTLEEVDMRNFMFLQPMNNKKDFGQFFFAGCSNLKKVNMEQIPLYRFLFFPRTAFDFDNDFRTIILKDKVIHLESKD